MTGVMLALSIVAVAPAAHAQVVARDAAGHTATKDTGGFEDVRGIGTTVPLTDGSQQSVGIGFPFTFHGNTHTNVFVSSEGTLSFSGGVGAPTALPNASAPNALIAPFWADLDLGQNPGATVHTALVGNAPARRFIVQWSEVALASDPGARLTFQVALQEQTGRIEFRYATMRNGDNSEGSGAASGSGASIGIEDSVGAVGLQAAFATDGFINSGDRVVIEPGPAPTSRLTFRTPTAPAGTEVSVELDLSGPIDGTTLIDAELTLTGTAPLPAIKAITVEVGGSAATLPNGEALPLNASSLRFQVPLDGSSVLAPRVVARVTLVVPAGAAPGTIYGLGLNNVALTGASVAPLVIGANLTVAAANPPVTVDSLGLTVVDQVTAGDPPAMLVIEALGNGKPVPNALVSLWIGNTTAINAPALIGTTDATGRVSLPFSGVAVGRSLLVATATGLASDARAVVTVVSPTPQTIPSTPTVSGTIASLYEYQVTGSVGGMTFLLERAPAGMTIDASGRITWVPGPTQVGTHEVVVRTVDGSPSQSFTVVIEPGEPQSATNARPTFAVQSPPTTAQVGQPYAFSFSATDPNGDSLTYTVQPALAGMAMTPTGQLSWIPEASQVGSQDILVLVSDGKGGMDAQVVSVTVSPTSGNAAPSFTSTAPGSAPLGTPFSYDVDADDPESDALTYALTTAPAGMTINEASGLINWTPWVDQVALQSAPLTTPTVDVTVRVTDAAGNTTDHPFTMQLTGTPSPVALPSSLDFGDVHVGESVTSYVRIDNGGALPLQVTSVTPGADPFAADLRMIGGELVVRVTYTPTAVGPSAATFVVTTANGSPATVSIPANANGVAAGSKPRLTSLPSFRAITNQPWIYPAKAGGAGLTYGLVSPPAGMTINPLTGVVRWTPTDAQAGNHTVTVSVTGSETTTQTFSLVAVRLALAVTSTPTATAPGVNDHVVTITVDATPSRTVMGSTPVGRLVVEHVIPGDGQAPLELLAGSASPALRDAQTTSEGHVLSWLVPLASTRLVHTVRAHDQVAGAARVLSTATRARLLRAPDVLGLGSPFSLLRSYPSLVANPRGLGFSPDDDLVLTRGSTTLQHLRPSDGVSQGSTAMAGGNQGASGTDGAGTAFTLQEAFLHEYSLGGASMRSTSTSGIGSQPVSSVSVDPVSRRRWFLTGNDARMHRITEFFGRHQNGTVQPVGLSVDASDNLWVVRTGTGVVNQVDPNGTILSTFTASGVNPTGLFREANGEFLFPGQGQRLHRYSAAGVALDSIYTGYYSTASLPGVSRDPITQELLLLSPTHLHRLGTQFGTRSPIGGATDSRAIARDPSTGNFYVLNGNARVYVFAPDMTPMGSWPTTGASHGHAMAFNPQTNCLEVLQALSQRLFSYTTSGVLTHHLRLEGYVSNARGMARNANNELVLVNEGLPQTVVTIGANFGDRLDVAAGTPQGATSDPGTGRRFVTDQVGNLVRTYDSSGAFVGQFVSNGVAANATWRASTGTMLLYNRSLRRVDERQTDGTLVRSTRVDHYGIRVSGISLRSTGELYLARTSPNDVVALSPQFGDHTPHVLAGVTTPNVVGIADDGVNLWVVNTTNDRVYQLDREGTPTGVFFSTLPITTPAALTYDPSTSRLVVAGNQRVAEFSTAGVLVKQIDLSTQVSATAGVVSTAGGLVILDDMTREVVRLDPQYGNQLTNGSITNARGMSVSPTGELWTVSSGGTGPVERRSSDGTVLGTWPSNTSNPRGIAFDGTRNLVRVLDDNTDRLLDYDPSGAAVSSTRLDQFVTTPRAVAVASNGDVLVADALGGSGARVVRLGAQFGRNTTLVGAVNATNVGDVGRGASGRVWLLNNGSQLKEVDANGTLQATITAPGNTRGIAWDTTRPGEELVVLNQFGASYNLLHYPPVNGAASVSSTPLTPSPAGSVRALAALGGVFYVITNNGFTSQLHSYDSSGAALATVDVSALSPLVSGVSVAADGTNLLLCSGTEAIGVTTAGVAVPALNFSLSSFGVFNATGIAFNGTNYRVVDPTEDRLYEMAPGGLPVTELDVSAFSAQPVGLTPADSGGDEFALIDDGTDTIQVFNGTTGAQVRFFSTLTYGLQASAGLAWDAGNNRYLAGQSGTSGVIFVLGTTGLASSLFSTLPFAAAPTDMCVDAGGLGLAITDDASDSVHTFTVDGLHVGSFSTSAFGSFDPSGIVWDGSNYRVADRLENSVFRIASTGLASTTWTAPFTSGIAGVVAHDDGRVALVDELTANLFVATPSGSTLTVDQTIDLTKFSVLQARGLDWDGTNYHVLDTFHDALFVITPGGVQVSTFTLPGGNGPVTDLAIGPGGELGITTADELHTFTTAGVLQGTISLGAFGINTAVGLTYDGTNYQVIDSFEDHVFEVAPAGLPVTSVDLAAVGLPAPTDLTVHPTRGTTFIIDNTTGDERLAEFSSAGALLGTQSLVPLGITEPDGLGVDSDGNLRVGDRSTDPGRVFVVPPTGADLQSWDLSPLGITAPTGLAFDPSTGHVWVTTLTTVYEVCAAPNDLRVINTLDLSAFSVTDAQDVGVDRTRNELLVLSGATGDQNVHVFSLPSPIDPNAGKVLLLVEGDAGELPAILQGAGHEVISQPLTSGALAAALDNSFSQVWIVNSQGAGTGPALTTADLDALQAWSAATARDAVVVDALGWRTHATCPTRAYTASLARTLQAAGGGLLLATGPEQNPTANPADGGGQVVASANQVLDRLNFNRFAGSYTTPATGLAGGGDFIDRAGAGKAWPGFATGSITHAAAPAGAQPNGRTLFSSLRGTYSAQTGSQTFPNNQVQLLSSTFGANEPDVSAGGISATAQSVLTMIPVSTSTVQGSSAVYLLSLTNVNDAAANFTLTPQGLPAGFVTTLDTANAFRVEAGATRYVLLGVDVPAGATVQENVFSVRADEVLPTAEVRDRGSASGSLHVFSSLIPLAASISPASTSEDAGVAVAYTLSVTNPQGGTVNFAVDVLGTSALGASGVSVTDFPLGGGATNQTNFSVTGNADPGDYFLTVRVRATDDPQILPRILLAKLTLGQRNDPPVAHAGADRTVSSPGGASVPVVLDGSGSFDPEGQALTYAWTGPGGPLAGVTPSVTLAPGAHTFTLVVNDGDLNSVADSVTITVGDTTPPVVLNQSYSTEQTNGAGTPIDLQSIVIASDDTGAGWTVAPASGTYPLGQTPVLVTVTDASGNSASATLTITVVDTTAPAMDPPADILLQTTDPTGAVINFPAATGVSDICDASVGPGSVTYSTASGTKFPIGTTVVTASVQDVSGNVRTHDFNVTVTLLSDTIAPTLQITAPTEGQIVANVTTVGVTMTYADNPGGAGIDPATLVVFQDGTNVSSLFTDDNTATQAGETLNFLTEGTHQVRARINDQAGNTSVEVVRTFVIDVTAPTWGTTTPANISLEQASLAGAVATWTPPTATDTVDTNLTITASHNPGDTFPLGVTTVTYTATDDAGHTTATSFTVTVVDSTPPAVSGAPGNVSLEATSGAGASHTWTAPTFTDICDANVDVTSSHAPGATFPLGTTTVTYTGTDDTGLTTQVSFTVTVVDTTPPTLSPTSLPNLTLEQTNLAGTPASWTAPTASDIVDGAVIPTSTHSPGATFPLGVTTVTYTATDAANNSASLSFTVTVVDTTPPSVASVPSDQTVEATSAAGAPVTWGEPTFSDLCDSAVEVVRSHNSGDIFPIGTTTVTYTGTDDSGLQTSASFTILVQDTTAPVISAIANQTVEQTALAGTPVSWIDPTITDAVDPSPIVTYSNPSGSTFPLGTTTVTVTATDAAGNSSSLTFDVTVEDTTAPSVASVTDVTAEATGPTGAVVAFGNPGVVDACDANPTIVCTPASGSLFPIGATTVTCSATDAAGNSANVTFQVIVVDTTGPTISNVPAPITAEQASAAGTVVSWADPSATDLVDPIPSVVCVPPSGSTFQLGETTVTCTATDATGNASTATFTVTIVDTAAPSLVGMPTDMTVAAVNASGGPATWTAPTATDVCDAAPGITSTHTPGATFPLGTTTVTYTATDASGNAVSASFTVTVTDQTAPVISGLPSPSAEQSSAAGAVVTWSGPTALDNVDGAVGVVSTPASGSTFPLGNTTVTATATDAAGNSATATFVVTVVDTTAPTLSAPNMTVEATSSLGANVASFLASATDVCDASVDLSYSGVPAGNQFPLGPTTVTVTATDDSGNTANASFVVSVVDTIPPAFQSQPAAVTVEQGNNAGTTVTFSLPAAVDLVDPNPTVTASPASGTVFPLGVTTVTVTATDFSGNATTTTFDVTVQDTIAPSLSTPANMTVEATGPQGAPVSYASPTATDQCDSSPTVGSTPPSGSMFALGTTTVTCTATDASGNQSQVSFTVTVVDTTPPDMTPPGTITVEQATAAGTAVTFPMPSITDLVDPNPTVTTSPANGSVFPLGTTPVTCIGTDAAGNSTTVTFNVVVVDTTPPTLVDPGDMTVPADDPSGATVTFPPAVANDVCDASPTVVFTPPSGSHLPVGTTTVMCTGTDVSGNTVQVPFDVTVEPFQNGDTTPPVITVTDPLVVEQATAAGTQVDDLQVSATDDTDPNPTVTCSPAAGTVFALGDTTVTCTATDQSGNTSTRTFVVRVVDTTAPVITQPADVAVEATGTDPVVVHFDDPVVNDICDALPLVECTPPSGTAFPVGRTTVTCSATDASGNTASVTFTVTVGDTTPPTFNLKFCKRQDYPVGKKPAALDVGDLNGDGHADVVTADFSSNTITVWLGKGDGTLGVKLTFKAGHCPSALRLGDLNGDGALDAVVTNAGGKSVSVFFGRGDGTFKKRKDTKVGVGPRGVALGDLDADGDLDVAVSNTRDRTVTLLLNNGSGKLKASSTNTVGAARPNAVVLNTFGGDALVDAATANGPVSVRRAWRASPAASTHSPYSGGHAFWLPDLPGGPTYVFEGPADLIEHDDNTATLQGVIVSSSDANLAWAVSLQLKAYSPKKGAKKELHAQNYVPQGTIDPSLWRFYKLESKSRLTGLRGFAGKTLKLRHRPTNKHYGFQVGRGANGKNLNLGASGWLGYRGSYKSNRGDLNVDLAAVTGGPSVSSWPGDGTGKLGSRADVEFGKDQRALTAADLDGDGDLDLAVADFGLNVVRVLTNDGAGNFSLGASVRVGFCPTGVVAGDFNGDGKLDLAASNAGSNDVSVLRGDGAGGFTVDDTASVGRYPSALQRGDFNGDGLLDLAVTNRDDCTVTILLNCGVKSVTVEQANADGTVVNYPTPTASDNTDPNPVVTCAPASGSTFPLGETTVTCTATDASGNSATVSFTVKVVDTTPPVIAAPHAQTVEANTAGGAIVAYPNVSVSDVCDASPALEFDPPIGSLLGLGTTTVSVTATDASGNSSSASFKVTVKDTVAPALSVPANVTLEQASGAGTAYDFQASAVDVADPAPVVRSNPPSGTVFPLGQTTVTCTATDASGNTATGTFTVTVVDTQAPLITAPADMTVEGDCASGVLVTYPEPTVRDVCDSKPEVVFDPPAGTRLTLGTHTVKISAADDSGNVSQASFTITVQDTQPPVIDCPNDLRVSVPPGTGAVPANDPRIAAWLATASATDLCDVNPKLYDDAPAAFAAGDTLVTFRAVDASGNSSSCQAVVHVVHEALEVEISEPVDGLITSDKVEVTYQVNGAAKVTVSGTRTLNGVVQQVDGTEFDAEGDYAITVRAETTSGAVATDAVTFSIDRTAPTVQVASPVATPHPGYYPASKYRYCAKGFICKLLDWLKVRHHRCPNSDFPIKVDLRGNDDDGITGGVAGTRLTLDGKPLPVGTTELTTATFVDAGLPVLGRHVLEVEVEDEAGNVGTARRAFEIVLFDDRNRMTFLRKRGSTYQASLWLKRSPTGSALDPTYRDVVDSTLRLRSLKTGREGQPTRIRRYPFLGLIVVDFRVSDCREGSKGFALMGRFHDSTGPAFVAELKVRK